MNKKIKIVSGSALFVLLLGLSINASAVFTPPTSNPGGGNIETPINSGDALQRKSGGLIVEFFRVMGLTLVGGNLEVSGTLKILGGTPGKDKVLVSDDVGLASWVDPSTLPGWGGGNGEATIMEPILLAGSHLTV